jgi:hypothetical protein
MKSTQSMLIPDPWQDVLKATPTNIGARRLIPIRNAPSGLKVTINGFSWWTPGVLIT